MFTKKENEHVQETYTMRKLIILVLLFPSTSFGQLTDTTCIQLRWLALKQTAVNKDVFLLDSKWNDSLDLVFTIKRLVESDKLNIYKQNEGPRGSYGVKSWYYIDYDQEMEEYRKDTSSFWAKDPYFEITVQSDVPLTDEYGDPVVITLPDGTQEYRYPAPDIYVFPSKECDEIRIKENRIYNESTKNYEFVAVGLSFYFSGGRYSRGHEIFWVDLNELFSTLENKSSYPWYTALINRNYQGFQYMQVSCYDDEIKE